MISQGQSDGVFVNEFCSVAQMCRSAKPYDYFLIVVGTLGAIGAGAALPVFTILFGSLINAFNPTGGGDAFSSDDLTTEINKVCLQFVYVAIGTAIASYLEVAFAIFSIELKQCGY